MVPYITAIKVAEMNCSAKREPPHPRVRCQFSSSSDGTYRTYFLLHGVILYTARALYTYVNGFSCESWSTRQPRAACVQIQSVLVIAMPASELTKAKLAEMAKSAMKATGPVEVLDNSVKIMDTKGEGFCGQICFVDMVAKAEGSKDEKKFNWIVKTGPDGDKLVFPLETIRIMKMEEAEIMMYSQVCLKTTRTNKLKM